MPQPGGRLGRGEALKKWFQEQNSNPQETNGGTSVEPSTTKETTSLPGKPGGRGKFLERLTSDVKNSFPNSASPSENGFSHKNNARNGSLSSSASENEFPHKTSHVNGTSNGLSNGDKKRMNGLEKQFQTLSTAPSPDEDSFKGTSGEKIELITNYLKLDVQEDRGIYQYCVSYEPEVDSRVIRVALLNQLKDVIKFTKSFDGFMLFLPFLLDDQVTVGKTQLHNGSTVEVKITFVKKMLMGDENAIQLYNIIFRRIMTIMGFTLHGRNFFDPRGAKPIPEHKLEVWPGFVTSVQEFKGGVMLCCDCSHRVLRQQTVHEIMMDLHSIINDKSDWKTDFTNLVVGQTVLTRYNNKVYRIDDVDFNSTPNGSFTLKNGEKCTYVDYYSRHYDIKISDRGQPLLKSLVKNKIKGEKTESMVDLVPELCYLSGITDEMAADHKIMKSIAQCTRIGPSERRAALEKFIGHILNNAEASKLLDDWGLSISKKALSVPGRYLPPEAIYFGGNAVDRNDNFNWEWNRSAASNPVLSAVDLDLWVVLCTRRDEQIARDFIKMAIQLSKKLGMNVVNPRVVPMMNDKTQSYLQELVKLKGQPVKMVVALLPLPQNDKYSAIKKMCCIENPIPSQVIITRTIRHPGKLRTVVQKILLQMNCKLGGTLWQVKMPVKNTMVIGMDTHHNASAKANSVGAVVASINDSMTRWYSSVYRQNNVSLELMEGLEMSITQVLQKYQEVNGALPSQIIFYRDGVGDGQLEALSQYEAPQIFRACKKMSLDYSPTFLFVVVQKRILTRLFHKGPGSELTNPPPGSVMDHTITKKGIFDFYLVSQNVRQGTVTPSHYVVVHNSTSMNADKIQRFSYKLTHLYYNWCGTIRVPAPCQYAHKLAQLVGEHLHREPDESLCSQLFYL